MPAEIDTQWLIDHMDKQFNTADQKRTAGFDAVHGRLNAMSETVAKHEIRIGSLETNKSKSDDRTDNWARTGATVILGSGGLAALWAWLTGGGAER